MTPLTPDKHHTICFRRFAKRRFSFYLRDIIDNRYLGLTFDTQTGINVLKALLGLGRDKVSVRLMLSYALSKIEHRREKLEKMKQLLQIKDSISISSLAKALGVTRQTIYNWRDAGYIFRTPQNQIDPKETVEFWEAIDDWVQ